MVDKKINKCRQCGAVLVKDVNWFKSFADKKHGRYYLCKQCAIKSSRKWQLENPERLHFLQSRNHHKKIQKYRKLILDLLGNKCNNPTCPVSPEKLDKRALHIDHVNGGAYQKGRRVNSGGYPQYLKKVYNELKNGSKDYQLLCAYCNWMKRFKNNELPTPRCKKGG